LDSSHAHFSVNHLFSSTIAMDLSYILNELGEDRSAYYNAVVPPIMQTSNFIFGSLAEMREKFSHDFDNYIYTRGNNPNFDQVSEKVAALEGAEDALLFSSGSAAIAAAVMVNVNAGDHIVCVHKPYSWTGKLLGTYLPRFGVTATMVAGDHAENFEAAIQPNTKVIYLESPNSFTFDLQDLAAVCAIARRHGIVTVVDNSYCTPLFQKPIAFGADLVVYSGTKYFGGHSDIVAGIVCGSRAMIKKIFHSEYMTLGASISPFNAWLMLRGLRTMPIRMKTVGESTLKIAQWLEQHPKIERVYYPFLPSHPQHELAKKQMTGGSGLFSIALKTNNMEEIERFCNSLKRFLIAVSWGSYESLIFPACVTLDAGSYAQGAVGANMVRVSIGLDEPEVLMADLDQALQHIS
jgi:cystathionine beta-lyase